LVDIVYTYKVLAAEVLGASPTPLTADEIWDQASRRGLTEKLRSIGKTPTATIYSDMLRETDLPESDFVRVGARPRRFWMKAKLAALGNSEPVPEPESPSLPVGSHPAQLSERELHQLLAWFAMTKLGGVHVKTILHERSRKQAFGEWVHPDLVGVLFPRRALDNERAIQVAATLSAPLCLIYSFEMKLKLDFGNLREAFFQTVSNSTWAHESYLVAARVSDNPEFLEELERLCSAFGVGVIEIPTEELVSSRVIVPARRRSELDWSTIDKLAEMNGDFCSFLKSVDADIKTDIHPADYDEVPADPQKYVEAKLEARRQKSRSQ
jgi:hypothetical protein